MRVSSGAASWGTPNLDNYLITANDHVVWRVGDDAVRTALPGEGLLVAVAAGDGLETGELASFTAVRVMAKLFGLTVPRKPQRVLLRYLHQAHAGLFSQAADSNRVLGTSLAVLWAPRLGDLAWAQVGDCCVIRVRDGRVSQLSIAHTRQAFAQREGRSGAVDGDAVLQRFIQGSTGLGDDVRLHLEPGLDVGHELLAPGDRYLLCSATVWRALSGDLLKRALSSHTAQQAAEQCVQKAWQHGSLGCFTAAVVFAD